MVELLAACAIMMCIGALAVPSIMDVVATSRLRSSVGGLSGLLQATRVTSIKKNQFTSIHFTTVNGAPVAYMKTATDTSSVKSGEQQEWFPGGFTKCTSPSGVPEIDPAMMGNLTSDPLQRTDPTFNSRGLPCLYDSSTGLCAPSYSFIYYFSYNAPIGHVRWAALGITAAGRVKTFYWNGTAWGS